MKYNPDIHKRRSIRLKGFDYSQPSAYLITICTYDKGCVFGDVVDGKIQLNDAGEIADVCWRQIPEHFPNVILDEYIIMPNHVHGIIAIEDKDVNIGVQNVEPLRIENQSKNKWQHIIPKSIGSIVRGFKIGVTKWFRQNTDMHVVWQRNYFERVIRNEKELFRIRDYIINNPLKWHEDKNNPSNWD